MKKRHSLEEQGAEKPCRDGTGTMYYGFFDHQMKKRHGFEEEGAENPCRDAATVSFTLLFITR